MKKTIGFLEYRSIARGMEAVDVMLKSGHVKLIQNLILCPGKLTTMIEGDIGALKNAIEKGKNYDPAYCINSFVIANVHPSILPALTGTNAIDQKGSWGMIETMDAASAIKSADQAVKAANIDLAEIRLARGMGGKGMVTFFGELGAVETAVEQAKNLLLEEGVLVATAVIASPHNDLNCN